MKLTLKHKRAIELQDEGPDPLFGRCDIHNRIPLRREGLYMRLWGLSVGLEHKESGIDPLWLRQWLPWREDQLFYRLTEVATGPSAPKRILIVLYLDPNLIPVFVIEDYLKKMIEIIDLSTTVLECLPIVGSFDQSRNLQYIHNVYHALANLLGSVPKFVSMKSIIKSISLKDCHFTTLGLEWICSDSFVVNLLCSKGAVNVKLSPSGKNTCILQKINLSPYHALEIFQDTENERIPRTIPGSQFFKTNFGHGGESINIGNIPKPFFNLSYIEVEELEA